MFFVVTRIKESLLSASPFLLHIFMIAAVGGYTLLGAYIMQRLESGVKSVGREELRSADKETVDGEPRNRRHLDSAHLVALSGSELATMIAPGIHICVRKALYNVLNMSECETPDWIGHVFSQIGQESDRISITKIDECYRNAEIHLNFSKATETHTQESADQPSVEITATTTMTPPSVLLTPLQVGSREAAWTFPNAVIFAFTLITTIGYGHIAPVTWQGQLFCIVFGFIGIPLALLTIADVGMFLNGLVKHAIRWAKATRKLWGKTKARQEAEKPTAEGRSEASDEVDKVSKEDPSMSDAESEGEERTAAESVLLFVVFLLYLLLGSAMIASYESEMDFFDALYFNYISITTIGLGDLIPRNHAYLPLTCAYITIGLALTTITVEIAAGYLKKLHYFGRKLDGAAEVEVWFGGKKMKLKNLIRNLGDQLDIPEEELKNFDFDNFVQAAIARADMTAMVDKSERKSSMDTGSVPSLVGRALQPRLSLKALVENIGAGMDPVGETKATLGMTNSAEQPVPGLSLKALMEKIDVAKASKNA